jgi:uncharacterized membrane protein required for colicin V production
MNWFDIVLIVTLIAFVWRCFWLGFIKTFGSFVGLVVGAIVGSYAYDKLFSIIRPAFFGMDNIGRLICFFLLLVVFSRIVYMIFVALDKAYDFISIIPFLGSINNMAGAILGALVGLLVCGAIVYAGARFFPASGYLGKILVESQFAPYFVLLFKILTPLVSTGIKAVKALF